MANDFEIYYHDYHDETLVYCDPYVFSFNGPAALFTGAPSWARAIQLPLNYNYAIAAPDAPPGTSGVDQAVNTPGLIYLTNQDNFTVDVLYQEPPSLSSSWGATLIDLPGGPNSTMQYPWIWLVQNSVTTDFHIQMPRDDTRWKLAGGLGASGANRWRDVRFSFAGLTQASWGSSPILPYGRVWTDIGDGAGWVLRMNMKTDVTSEITPETRTYVNNWYVLGTTAWWIKTLAPTVDTSDNTCPAKYPSAFARVRIYRNAYSGTNPDELQLVHEQYFKAVALEDPFPPNPQPDPVAHREGKFRVYVFLDAIHPGTQDKRNAMSSDVKVAFSALCSVRDASPVGDDKYPAKINTSPEVEEEEVHIVGLRLGSHYLGWTGTDRDPIRRST